MNLENFLGKIFIQIKIILNLLKIDYWCEKIILVWKIMKKLIKVLDRKVLKFEIKMRKILLKINWNIFSEFSQKINNKKLKYKLIDILNVLLKILRIKINHQI